MFSPRILALVVGIVLLPSSANSCELSEEFIELRSEAFRDIRSAFNSCYDSVGNYQYWVAYAECIEAEGSIYVGSRCAHALHRKEPLPESLFQHCEVLRPTEEQAKDYLAELMAEHGIERCKDD